MSGVLALPAIVLAIAISDATVTNAALLESKFNLVRKEKEVVELAQTPTVVVNDGGNETHHADGTLRISSTAAAANFKSSDICDNDYPLGTADTVDCSSTATADLLSDTYDSIQSIEACKQAAVEANASHPIEQFIITYQFQNIHPKGCFTASCSNDAPLYDDTMQCYYFNPVLGPPEPSQANPPQSGVSGRPVCRRPKYLHGVNHTGDAAFVDGGCPTGYETITNELNCSEAASCMGFTHASVFVITEGNRSQRDHHPEGCFIQNPKSPGAQPQVMFNPVINDGTTPKPRWPVGTPICNVSQITFLDDSVTPQSLGPIDSHLHMHAIAHSGTHW